MILETQRKYNAELSEFISELSKLQKRHLEQVQVIEKLPAEHYQLSAEVSILEELEAQIDALFEINLNPNK